MTISPGIYKPRCMVNGWTPIECSIHVSSHQSADTFVATLSLDDRGGQQLADSGSIQITVMASNDGPPTTQMFTGYADYATIDWATRLITLRGRDNTSGPLDKKTNEKWLNKQPQDVIQDLAQRSGLQVEFSGQGGDKAGRKYKDDYNRITELDSHWNVIVKLAKELGCIANVKGNTLYITPWDQANGGTYTVNYRGPSAGSPARGDVLRLQTGRDLQIAKGVQVTVNSWQQKEAQAIRSQQGQSGGIEHTLKAANLTQQQADSIAKGRLGEIQSHERTITVVAPGDVNISPQMKLRLRGTGTGADMEYVISDIDHRWSWAQGYIMTIRGRNKAEGSSETGGTGTDGPTTPEAPESTTPQSPELPSGVPFPL